jgi:hypothetical protein
MSCSSSDLTASDLNAAAVAFATANACAVLDLGADAMVLAAERDGKRGLSLQSIAKTTADWRAMGWTKTADAVDVHAKEGTGVFVVLGDAEWFVTPIRWGSQSFGGETKPAASA